MIKTALRYVFDDEEQKELRKRFEASEELAAIKAEYDAKIDERQREIRALERIRDNKQTRVRRKIALAFAKEKEAE